MINQFNHCTIYLCLIEVQVYKRYVRDIRATAHTFQFYGIKYIRITGQYIYV